MTDFTTELADLVKSANRAIVAQQLRFAGSVLGNVAAFKQEVGMICDRYVDKLYNLESQGAEINATRTAILALCRGASDATNARTVKVPAAA